MFSAVLSPCEVSSDWHNWQHNATNAASVMAVVGPIVIRSFDRRTHPFETVATTTGPTPARGMLPQEDLLLTRNRDGTIRPSDRTPRRRFPPFFNRSVFLFFNGGDEFGGGGRCGTRRRRGGHELLFLASRRFAAPECSRTSLRRSETGQPLVSVRFLTRRREGPSDGRVQFPLPPRIGLCASRNGVNGSSLGRAGSSIPWPTFCGKRQGYERTRKWWWRRWRRRQE